MYQQLKNEQNPQRAKRLAFAQQIRKRSRNNIIKQIRIDFQTREKVWIILSQPEIDTLALYTMMQMQKTLQYNVSVVVAEWLVSQCQGLNIQTKRECLHWGFIFISVMQNKTQLVQLILSKYLHFFIEKGIQFEDIQIVYTLICCALNIVAVIKTPIPEQILTQSIQKTIQAQFLLVKKTKININQLQFCSRVLTAFPKYCIQFTQNRDLIQKMLQFFSSNIDKVHQQYEIIRIFIFFTYYDRDLYTHFTEILVENNVLQHIKFILEFMEVEKYQMLMCNALVLVENIIANIGTQDVLDSGIWSCIKSLFDARFNYNKLTKQAIHCYLVIIQNVMSKQSQLQRLRQGQAVKNIIYIVDRFGDHDGQIIKDAVSSLQNLLRIGQQIKQCNGEQSSANVYGLALKYTNSIDQLRRFQHFHELFEKYHIYF